MNKLFLLLLLCASTAYGRTANNAYVMPGSGNLPIWGQLDVSQSGAVKNQLIASSAPNVQNFLLNSDFSFWQAGTSITIANAASTYQADQWYVKNSLGTNGVITFSQQTGSVGGDAYAGQVKITTAPTAAQVNGTELYQPLANGDSQPLYNQTASFGINVKALGNVNQVGLQFYYSTSEVKLATGIG